MIKKVKTFLFILLINLFLFFANIVWAQQEFKVLISKGKNYIINKKDLFSGDVLDMQDVISITGYLNLLHKSGKAIELVKPGLYKVRSLSENIVYNKQTIEEKYANFILAELNKNNEKEDIHENYRKNMKVLGSVERTTGDNQKNIVLNFPSKTYIFRNDTINLKISWHGKKDSTYVIEIMNLFDEIIYKKEVKDTIFFFNPLSIKGKFDHTFLIKVYNASNTSPTYSISFKEKEIEKSILETYYQLDDNLPKFAPFSLVAKAVFLEERGFYFNAEKMYLKAIDLNSHVPEYKKLYFLFLQNNK